jgi:hypothetical protein
MVTGSPVRLSTMTFATLLPLSARAVSTADLSSTLLPPRQPPSAVITIFALASLIRSRSEFAEKPPNTTECVAPMRAQACMAMTASGTIGM